MDGEYVRDRDEPQARAFNAFLGAETPDEGIQALAFLPHDLTVDAGETNYLDLSHTRAAHAHLSSARTDQTAPRAAPVAPSGSTCNGNAFLNSGILLNGANYSVTFGAADDFPFRVFDACPDERHTACAASGHSA